MRIHTILFAASAALVAAPAAAEPAKVENQREFVQLIAGKTLKRPLIEITVTPDGQITGKGVRWDVQGTWTWKDGYFCRDLFWGGDPLGYNCQEVRVNGNRIRFTSDRGQGDSAEFRLN